MANLLDIRRRIKSVKNTQQITKAMKQVAASKIRRAEMVQKQARPYAEALSQMLKDLMAAVGSVDHPFMKPGHEGAPRGVILMTADKGLAGAFNSNVIREGERYARANPGVVWYAVGTKARNATRRMEAETAFGESLSAGEKLKTAQAVAAQVTDDFVAGKISEIVLISSKLVSMLSQRPEVQGLVPIKAPEREETKGPRAVV